MSATPGQGAGPDTAGTVTFGQSRVPALQSGEYTITVDHAVTNSDKAAQDSKDQAYINHTFTTTKHFAVTGARFTLTPNLVHSVFPPDNSRGEYDDVLAHIVLVNPTLPWQRTAGHDATPWLALLLFHPDDGVGAAVTAQISDLVRDAPSTPAPVSGSAATARTVQARSGPLPPDAVSYPKLTLDPGESWSDPCRIIDVPVAVFSAIAPAVADLSWLAHVRTLAGVDVDDDGTSAVVVTNRLPLGNADCTAHLVSLENLAGILPTIADGSYVPATITVDGGANDGQPAATVRLVSLASWTFRPVEPAETFDGFLEHLDSGPLHRPVPVIDSPGSSDRLVANALQMGYTALDHGTRLGDRTVTWVRGPLVPFDVDATQTATPVIAEAEPGTATATDPIASADSVMCYDPDTGMFDATYAAAWQIGRLLAVQNLSFAAALYDWKRAVARTTVQAVEREFLRTTIGDTAPGVGTANHGLEVLHAVMQLVATHVAPELASPAPSTATSTPNSTPDPTAISLPARTTATSTATSTAADRCVSLRPRRSLFDRHAEVLADATALATIHADTELPDLVSTWLTSLARLSGVPFNYLVPDEAMLPAESVRFFHVDRSWIAALIEGAMSIGTSTAGDAAHDSALRPLVSAATAVPLPRTGLLLRSAVVAGWPKLRVAAYDIAGAPLFPVRADVLSPTILLAIFDGVVASVDLMEPPLGLHFGVRSGKDLRWVTVPSQAPPGARPGDQIVGSAPGVPAVRRDPSTLAVSPYAGRLAEAVDAKHANDLPGTAVPRPFTAAEFALQLVEGVEQFRFVNAPTAPGSIAAPAPTAPAPTAPAPTAPAPTAPAPTAARDSLNRKAGPS